MKSILISIQPKWCELIANGEKTIEVRKTRPKIETPFKVYVYQTKNEAGLKHFDQDSNKLNDFLIIRKCGKVIGEFVCDKVTCIQAYYGNSGEKHLTNLFGIDIKNTCLSLHEIFDYIIGDKKDRTGWLYHITDLKIYDKPKELGEFMNWKKYKWSEYGNLINNPAWYTRCHNANKYAWVLQSVTKPPQSWCYVEELQ